MKYSLSVLLALLFATTANAQITIAAKDFFDYYGNESQQNFFLTSDTTGLRAMTTNDSVNAMWDLSGLQFSLNNPVRPHDRLPFTTDLPMASDSDFASATFVYRDSVEPSQILYSFYRLSDSGLYTLGQSQDSLTVPLKRWFFDPAYLDYKFPLTYGMTWNNKTIIRDLHYHSANQIVDTFTVDGYGTLKLPGIPAMQAIRIKQTHQGEYLEYYWFTKGGYTARVQVFATGEPRGAEYTVPNTLLIPNATTITANEFIQNYGYFSNQDNFYSQDTSGIRMFAMGSGTEALWDFSTRSFSLDHGDSPGPTLLPYPGGAPFASDSDFNTATFVFRDSVREGTLRYSFYRLTDQGIWALGESEDSMGTPRKRNSYSSPYLQFKFPMTYGTMWTNDVKMYDHTFGTSNPRVDTFLVDGYGSIKLPGTLEIPALRLKQMSGGSNVDYSWFTNSPYSVSVTVNQSGYVSDVRYTAPKQAASVAVSDVLSGLGLTVREGGGGILLLDYSLALNGPLRIEMTDLLGRVVRVFANGTASAGRGTLTIDRGSLPLGAYFIRASAGGEAAMKKVVVWEK